MRSSLLELPEASLHRLFIWAYPQVRTKRAALAVLPTGPGSFMPSPKLLRLAEAFEDDPRVAIDHAASESPDRFLLLAVRRDEFDAAIAWIAQQCRELQLVLFDPEGERLVVPSSNEGAAPYHSEPDVVTKVRQALQSVPLSGDRDDDARELTVQILNVTGGQLAETSLLPLRVLTPFDVPRSLRFAIPDLVPPQRQTKARRAQYLADLAAERAETRRAAAFDLGGWQPSENVDRRLQDLLETEPDRYVRAVVALSLALRGTTSSGPIVRCAEDVVANGELNPDQRFATLAASVALLAAAITVVRTSGEGGCDECLALARRVAMLPGEAARAEAVSTVLAEQCLPSRRLT